MEEYKKKYEEAMLRMNKWVEGSEIIDPKEVAEFVFPELKESEEERIREWLIRLINTAGYRELDTDKMPCSRASVVAWLEKRVEQKPNFCHHEVDFSGCSEEYRKAYYDGWNNCNQQHDQLEAEQKSADKVEPKFKVGDIIRHKDSLAEYVIESISGGCYHGKGWGLSIDCDEDYELVEQRHAWSEEDEKMWITISDLLWEGYKLSDKKVSWNKIRCWLFPKIESLKERYTWKPSDEQIKALNYVINLMASSESPTENDYYYNVLKDMRTQLKKLR